MILVFLGAPGCGKGTQAHILSQKYSFEHLSTGEILRKKNECNSILGGGGLVNDDYVFNVLWPNLNEALIAKKNVVLDGFPRTVPQAQLLQDALLNMDSIDFRVIHFDVSFEDLIKRISGRIFCQDCGQNYHEAFDPPLNHDTCVSCGAKNLARRQDDDLEVFKKRFLTYEEKTCPLLHFYEKQIVTIPANLGINKVHDHLVSLLHLRS